MEFVEFIVCPLGGALSQFIESCIFYRGNLTNFEGRVFRFIPTPYIWINIPFSQAKLLRPPGTKRDFIVVNEPYFCGFNRTPIAWYAEGEFSGISLQVKAHAIPALFGKEVNNLVDAFGEADMIFGDSLSELREQLIKTEGLDERLGIISSFFEFRLFSPPARAAHSLDLLLAHGSPSIIRDQALQQRVTERTLFKDIKANFHIAPKMLSRLARFWRYAQELNPSIFQERGGTQPDDYYDDSHQIRDFKTFSGLTPHRYERHMTMGAEAPLGVLLYNEATGHEINSMQAVATGSGSFPSLLAYVKRFPLPRSRIEWRIFVYYNSSLIKLTSLNRLSRGLL